MARLRRNKEDKIMIGRDGLIGFLLVVMISTGCAATRGEYGLIKPHLPNDGFLGE